jgi:hypothetical protein
LHTLFPKELFQGNEVGLSDFFLENFQPDWKVKVSWRKIHNGIPMEGAYQLLPIVWHSRLRSLFWSPVSESTYSLEENGMELRVCRPLAELPLAGLTAESLLSFPESDAVSFGFLEGVFELWLGAEPSISKSVLWRFPLVVLVEGASFGFVLSSRSGSDEATILVETFSSLEATAAWEGGDSRSSVWFSDWLAIENASVIRR